MDVPFQLIDADEFDALEVAIAAAERSCNTSKFSMLSGSPELCRSTISDACSPLSEPIKLACVSAAKILQISHDVLNAGKEVRESSAQSLESGHVCCDAIKKYSEGEPSCGLLIRSENEGDGARFLSNAARDNVRGFEADLRSNAYREDEREFERDLRSNADGDNCDGDANKSMLEVPKVPYSPNAGFEYEAEEATAFSQKETHSKPCCSRRLPAWQSYAGSHQHKILRRSDHTKIIQTLISVDEEAQLACPPDFPANVSVDDSRRPWGLAPSTCRVTPKCKLPSLQFKGQIIYSITVPDAENAANELLRLVEAKKGAAGNLVSLGFDTEWKVVFKRGAQPRKVAVLQLCLDADNCNVFHVIHSGIPLSLRTILEDPLVSKVGVGAYGDAAKLAAHYNVRVKGVKDLSGLANLKLAGAACAKRSWSLASLAEELLGKQIEKNGSIRMGDWEVEELSEVQLQYAATDAFASLYLFEVLLTFPDPHKEVSLAVVCNT